MCKCAAGHEIQHQTCSAPNATILADIGEPCADDLECQSGAKCRSQRCACPEATETQGGYCSRLGKFFEKRLAICLSFS